MCVIASTYVLGACVGASTYVLGACVIASTYVLGACVSTSTYVLGACEGFVYMSNSCSGYPLIMQEVIFGH